MGTLPRALTCGVSYSGWWTLLAERQYFQGNLKCCKSWHIITSLLSRSKVEPRVARTTQICNRSKDEEIVTNREHLWIRHSCSDLGSKLGSVSKNHTMRGGGNDDEDNNSASISLKRLAEK